MLTVHRSEQTGVLADVLAAQLAEPLVDPMQPEVVAVPARGVERWLQQRLALRLGAGPGGDGIAANIDFPSTDQLLQRVVLATADDPEAAQAWYSERLVWPVLRVLDAHRKDPRLVVLANHLSGPDGQSRRLSAASTIANLFAAYGWQRPAMLADWATGGGTDGSGRRLDETLAWQPWFWQLVRDEIGAPHLAEQLGVVVETLRQDPGVVDLPERIALFGATRLPESLRVVLAALAEHREVSLYLPHPSAAMWSTVADRTGTVPRPRTAAGAPRPAHPLLAALARDVQELQEVLAPVIDRDEHHVVGHRGDSLLAAVQAGLAADDLAPRSGPSELDDSLEVHACHGPERQVEVLRDRLLRLFDDHRDLQPRDVLIMCPDVEAFAPLIQGAFGQRGLDHPGFSLRVRLADRGLRGTNEILDVLAAVVDLAAGRVRAGELLDLLGLPAVARRFAVTEDEFDTVSGWIARSGVRWAIDEVQRDRFGMAGFPQGTASVGRDRLLLGVLAEESENQWLGAGLPMAGLESTKIDLAGRFAEFIGRIGTLLGAMDQRRSAHAWAELLVAAIDDLTEPGPDTQWHRAQAIGMINDSLGAAGAGDLELGRDDVRGLMRRLVASRPTRSNFCTGELTVCTLTPMRSVPHRAVVLLGMDSGSFPRAASIDGDDILRRVPLIGERDRGDEDRQVFLDAIGSAVDHLLVFYTGADPVTGATVPPPVVVSELIDTAECVAGRTGVVQRHTLHAFDARNFQITGGTEPISYDTRLLRGTRALAQLTASGGRGPARSTVAAAQLPPADASADIDLADLIDFFQAPTERFVRQRLGAVLPDSDETHPDQLEVTLDGLQTWRVGDRYLRSFLGGADPGEIEGAEVRRGELPPFGIGQAVLSDIREKAQAIGRAAAVHRTAPSDTIDVRVRLSDGRRLNGTVNDAFDNRLVHVTFSKLGAKYRLASWIRLLAVAAGSARPVREALTIGAARGTQPGAQLSRLTLSDDPLVLLEKLVAIRDAGLRAPLWLPPDVADGAAQSFGGAGRADRALLRIRNARDFQLRDRYASWLLYDDPGRAARVDELIAFAGAAPFGAIDPLVPDLTESGLTAAARRIVGLSVAVYAPLRAGESST